MLSHARIRQDFPGLAGRVYLNTAAEGVPPAVVGAALRQYFEHKQMGMDGRDLHFACEQRTKALAARLYGLDRTEVAFCSCSAEAVNLLRTAVDLQAGDEVVVHSLEFPSGFTPWLGRVRLRVWQDRDGQLELADLEALLNRRTRLVLVSMVSFFNGVRIPLARVAAAARQLAPDAIVAVDVTQAAGRIPLVADRANPPQAQTAPLDGADMFFASTHKWLLGTHGGCVVGIPAASAARLTTSAGGWYHLQNAFAPDRFERRVHKLGAESYATGMPNFPAIYALEAALDYLHSAGVETIALHADRVTRQIADGIGQLGIQLLAPPDPELPSGILAFRHPQADRIHRHLLMQNIHIMNHAGRLRIAVHGYNTPTDAGKLLSALAEALAT